MKLTLKELPPD